MRPAWLLISLLLAPWLLSGASTPTPPTFDIHVSVRPLTTGPVELLRYNPPGMLHCTAVVLPRPGAAEPLATLEMDVFRDWRDRRGIAVVYRDAGPFRVRLSVALLEHRVQTTVTVSEDGRIIARHGSEVWLPPVRLR